MAQEDERNTVYIHSELLTNETQVSETQRWETLDRKERDKHGQKLNQEVTKLANLLDKTAQSDRPWYLCIIITQIVLAFPALELQ